MSVFDDKQINFEGEPWFLGAGRNVLRLDLNIEQHIQKMTDNAIGLMWFKQDYSYKSDAVDYSTMSPKLQVLFLKNLKFQTLWDSVASRTVSEVFLPVTTNPQLETWWTQHAFFEANIHSATYAEIIKALPVDAKEVFDDIMVNDHILRRAKPIVEIFDNTVMWNARKTLDIGYDLFEHKKSIFKSLYALNILEAMLFKTSFLTSFAFKENGMMDTTGIAIGKINLDEINHYGMTVHLIKGLLNSPDWIHAFKAVEEEIYELYAGVVEADGEWADYLFIDKPQLLGLNATVLKEYVSYNMRIVMSATGLTPPENAATKDPCIWARAYSKPSSIQTAQKEKDNANYLLGKLNKHIPSELWETW